MPIPRPTTKTIISTTGWGIPVTDEVNRLTPLVDSNVTRIGALETTTAKTAWTAPVLGNGWVNLGSGYSPVVYCKEGQWVHIEGVMKNGTIPSVAFTLPVGYRPTRGYLQISCASGTSFGFCEILTNGQVYVASGAAGSFAFATKFSVLT